MEIKYIQSDLLRVGVLPFGASLVDVWATGLNRNLVLGFRDPAHHQTIPVYAGAIIGPIANRIRKGAVRIGTRTFQMPLNEQGRTSLHSGPAGLHAHLWQIMTHRPDQITLRTTLPDGACGLPGNRRFTATYRVEADTLTLELVATTDAITAINLAAHPYWNLDGTPDISGHHLQVFANHLLPTDIDNLPTGELTPANGHRFDFRAPQPVPLDPALDLNFCLSDHMRQSPEPAAELTGRDGTRLRIATTAPGLQVYGGAHLPALKNALTEYRDLGPFGAIALEPQHWPDAPAHPDFLSVLLRPTDTYRQISAYAIKLP